MSKINITLASGSALDKPLVSAFKGNSSTYVVLDNEVNGTMGLPIILVSKFENNRLIKINDQNEWNSVKEILRNIIAGNQVDYISVPDKIGADDLFFSQLTLPIASFESLKNNYKLTNESPVGETPVTPEVTPVAPAMEPTQVAPSPMPNMMPETPVMPEVIPNPATAFNSVVTPVEQPTPVTAVTPVMPSAPVEQTTAIFNNSEPNVPNVEPIPVSDKKDIDFSTDKEAFLKACENMFDALVAKFNK